MIFCHDIHDHTIFNEIQAGKGEKRTRKAREDYALDDRKRGGQILGKRGWLSLYLAEDNMEEEEEGKYGNVPRVGIEPIQTNSHKGLL